MRINSNKMKQYRIVEHTQGNNTYYTIQEYKWFIFFYWSTMTEWNCDTYGYSAGEYEKRFGSIIAAQLWLKETHSKTKKVVKYITL